MKIFSFVAAAGFVAAQQNDKDIAALVKTAETEPDFEEGFGIALDASVGDMWDETRWNNAVTNWDNSRSRWRNNFAETERHQRNERAQRYSSDDVASLIDEMLSELEALGIAELDAFCEAWTEYLCDNFDFHRGEEEDTA